MMEEEGQPWNLGIQHMALRQKTRVAIMRVTSQSGLVEPHVIPRVPPTNTPLPMPIRR